MASGNTSKESGNIRTETGAQLFARLGTRQSLVGLESCLFGSQGPCPKDVVELYGDAGVGKSQILLHLTATCILPPSWLGVPLDGMQTNVLLIDTDYHFSVMRLACLLESRIVRAFEQTAATTVQGEGHREGDHQGQGDAMLGAGQQWRPDMPIPSNEEVESFVTSCLQRLYVVRCSSSDELLVTIYSLEAILSAKAEFSIVLIDTISAFHWVDKGACLSYNRTENIQQQIAEALELLISTYHLTLVVTKQEFFKPSTEASQPSEAVEHQEYLSPAWQKMVTRRITLSVMQDCNTAHVHDLVTGQSSAVMYSVEEHGIVFEVQS